MTGLGLNIGADLQAEIGSKLDALQQVGTSQLKLGWRKYQPIVGSITGVGSQTVVATIAGPEAGKLWHVHRVTFAPQQGVACATPGTIFVGKGTGAQAQAQGSGQIVAGSPSQFIEVERTTTVPGVMTFGRAQFVLVYPMNLMVFWASGTGGVGLVVDGDAYEYLAETTQPI